MYIDTKCKAQTQVKQAYDTLVNYLHAVIHIHIQLASYVASTSVYGRA